MDLTLDELSGFVIKKSDEKELSDENPDLDSLNILMVLYGPKKIATVVEEAGYKIEAVQERIIALIKDGLVEVVDGKNKIIEAAFIKYMEAQLFKAVGPLAAILLEDLADELGHEINFFPSSQVNTLIDLLVEEIQREDKADEFKRNVTAELKIYNKE